MSWNPRSWWQWGKGAAPPSSPGAKGSPTSPDQVPDADDPSAKGGKGPQKGDGWPADPWWGYADGWTPNPWWQAMKGDDKAYELFL